MFRLTEVTRTFDLPRGPVHALSRVSFEISQGEYVVVRGPSGSGKTTLLLTLGGMQRPSSGQVRFRDRDLYALPARRRARLREKEIGFVFQMFHLIPYLTVEENILLGASTKTKQLPDLLSRLNLSHRKQHLPAGLSAGEKQRAAMARALIREPDLLLADEPTGNLDPQNAAEIMAILSGFHERGGTVVVVTHGRDADAGANRIIYLKENVVEKIECLH